MTKKKTTPVPETVVDKLNNVTSTDVDSALNEIYASLPTTEAELREELIHMIVQLVQLQHKNQELMTQLANQQSHLDSMERQIVETSNIPKPEPSEIDELSMLIEAALREEAQVHVSVNVTKSEQREFTFGI